MSILSEFKAFAVKGNVVDMAVGIIIGAEFGKIVTSFVGGGLFSRPRHEVDCVRSQWGEYRGDRIKP